MPTTVSVAFVCQINAKPMGVFFYCILFFVCRGCVLLLHSMANVFVFSSAQCSAVSPTFPAIM